MSKAKTPMVNEPLNKEMWAGIHNSSHIDMILQNFESGKLSCQTQEMIIQTRPGDRVLEIGCGSGATTLSLASAQRKCTALDYTESSLALVSGAASKLSLHIDTILADATEELPFELNSFDVVFQAGLLEHFQRDQRIQLLRNWSKVGKRIISIIPNASSIAYRTGKSIMEKKGTWIYGLELPQSSLCQEFFAADLRVINEYTIGEEHALNFLPPNHYLRKALSKWLSENQCEDNCNQGYLLVTIGEKISG